MLTASDYNYTSSHDIHIYGDSLKGNGRQYKPFKNCNPPLPRGIRLEQVLNKSYDALIASIQAYQADTVSQEVKYSKDLQPSINYRYRNGGHDHYAIRHDWILRFCHQQ